MTETPRGLPQNAHELGERVAAGESADDLMPPSDAATSVPPWLGVGLGHLNDPRSPSTHRAVLLTLATPHGQMVGWLAPGPARELGENLIGHADACTELTVADDELLRLIVPGKDGG